MASLDTFHKRLRDEIVAVEREIQAHNQQAETLSKRLEGLRRAIELFGSDQAAVAELLQTSIINGSVTNRMTVAAPAGAMQRTAPLAKTTGAQKQPGRSSQSSSGNTKRAQPGTRTGGQNGGLSRVDMIAAVLKRHPRRTVRDLIALLDKEYRWKTTESAVTRNLYTRRDKFAHTQPDRATNRLVTWSVK
jgi:hypothetical protein